MNNQNKFIDTRKVIRSKSLLLAKLLPRFVLNYIRRIVHEDEVNQMMHDNGHLNGLGFVDSSLKYLGAEIKLVGLENIPTSGGVILASNHPLGGLDGVAFMHAVGRVRSDLQFLVNDILLNIKNFEPLFIPVNKHGANPRFALKMIEEAYASNAAVLVFPAGLVSRKISGRVQDLPWTKSFISKAVRYNKAVIPVHISGRNSNRFYNLSWIRRKLGIKANVEMFLLVDEMYRQLNSRITLTFGKPIPAETFDDTKSQTEWAAYVRDRVYELPASNSENN